MGVNVGSYRGTLLGRICNGLGALNAGPKMQKQIVKDAIGEEKLLASCTADEMERIAISMGIMESRGSSGVSA